MNKELLIKTGEAAFGANWQTDLAKRLDVSARSVRYWLSGERQMPNLNNELVVLLNERKAKIDSVINELKINQKNGDLKMTKFIKAFRTTENEVCAMYSHQSQEFVVFWNNINPETGVIGDYDLQIKCLANNENLVEKVENAISSGESDDNQDVELYLAIRDTFDKTDCESV